MNIKIQLENYLTERFNYNPKIDHNDDTEAKKTLSEFDYNVGYYNNKNFYSTIKDNFDYKFLIPSINVGDKKSFISPIEAIYEYEFSYKVKGIDTMFYDTIMELSQGQADELQLMSSDVINLLHINYFYIGNFGCISTIFDLKYDEGAYGVEVSIDRLTDPFYTYPELDFFKKMKELFNIDYIDLIMLFDEEMWDYGTYQESFDKEVYINYYKKYLKPYIYNSADKEVNFNLKKRDTLNEYLFILEAVERDLLILACCKNVPNELSFRFSQMKDELRNKRKEVPTKYRDIKVIKKELENLIK